MKRITPIAVMGGLLLLAFHFWPDRDEPDRATVMPKAQRSLPLRAKDSATGTMAAPESADEEASPTVSTNPRSVVSDNAAVLEPVAWDQKYPLTLNDNNSAWVSSYFKPNAEQADEIARLEEKYARITAAASAYDDEGKLRDLAWRVGLRSSIARDFVAELRLRLSEQLLLDYISIHEMVEGLRAEVMQFEREQMAASPGELTYEQVTHLSYLGGVGKPSPRIQANLQSMSPALKQELSRITLLQAADEKLVRIQQTHAVTGVLPGESRTVYWPMLQMSFAQRLELHRIAASSVLLSFVGQTREVDRRRIAHEALDGYVAWVNGLRWEMPAEQIAAFDETPLGDFMRHYGKVAP
jgi:hypothetical protein